MEDNEIRQANRTKTDNQVPNILGPVYNILKEWKRIARAVAWGALIGLVIGFSLPKQYTVTAILAPESNKQMNNLAGMAAMLGIGGLPGGEVDALNIRFFPDIVKSTPFLLDLFPLEVSSINDKTQTNLDQYLEELKYPWWHYVIKAPFMALNKVLALFTEKKEAQATTEIDPFRLTKQQATKLKTLRKSILCNVDRKTGIITISVTLQDPKITAQVADRVIVNLQQYITNYRTSKAQKDCDYLEQLYNESKNKYFEAQEKYARYEDANNNIIRHSASTERERLRNEMNLAYQIYGQITTQLQMAQAKVQEARPVFAVVEPASIPLTNSGLGKAKILIIWMFLAFAGASAWIAFGKESYLIILTYIKDTKRKNIQNKDI